MNMEKIKILIVEDNPIVAEDLRVKLLNLGYGVTATATSGEQALQSVVEERPDIALMDIRLGSGMSGIDTALKLKEEYQLSVIYLTAHADDDTIARAKLTEPYGYIIKPFDDNELKSVIELALYKQQSDRRLRESNQWFKTTLNSLGDGVVATDMAGQITFINPVAVQLTGWPAAEAVGRPLEEVFEIIDEQTRKPQQNPASQVIDGAQVDGLASHSLLISREGREFPIKKSGAPIILGDREVLGAVLVFQDDSEAREAERNILAQKQKAEQYLDLATVIFIGLDHKGRVTLANQKACTLLGVEEDEVCGLDWLEHFVPESHQEEVSRVLQQLLAGDLASCEYYENPILTKAGEQRQIAWRNTCLTDGENAIVGLLSAGEDITEKVQLQSRLQQAQKMEAIGTLAGGIAHDFNNILSSVLGFADLSLDLVAKDSVLEDYLQEIRSAGLRAKDVVRQILSFARQADETIKPVRVDGVAREALRLLRASIPSSIQIRESVNSVSSVMGAASQLHQILMNLCTNAAQAMEERGGILEVLLDDISVEYGSVRSGLPLNAGQYVKIQVADTGVGIPQEQLSAIFEPYFTTKPPGEGTGMGLAVVHGIVEGYGGRMSVESTLGLGTIFSIYLPAAEESGSQRQVESEPLAQGKERILFVDDEPNICTISERMLTGLGYAVTTCVSSSQALALVTAEPLSFDLVISDLTMPEYTGDRLAWRIREIRPDIPVILSTGYSKIVQGEEFAKLGVQAIVYKPLGKAELARTVRRVLDEQRERG
ncbi:hybrid sensor histidine kinase/response regulator [Desulfogranum mediterraneum]|uniref:hybrid sensor histidine kinase/response regulator n=1 Tax=Desulfogranum mediterraneum TaxID=160661 RepID=UPI000429D037|nr:response regulator [Desulfogranum mediterraneum]